MREPGRPEVRAYALGQPLVLAEDHSEDERTPDAVRPAAHGTLHAIAHLVPEPRDTATTTDLAPGRSAEHDVDPLTREPRALVEAAVASLARLRDTDDRLEDGSSRRRPADGKDEQHALAERTPAKESNLRGNAHRPRGDARGTGDDDPHRPGLADLGRKRASGHRFETQRAPPEPRHGERDAERRHARAPVEKRDPDDRGDTERDERNDSGRNPVRGGEPRAGRTDEQRRPVELDGSPHGVTSSRSCSTRVGPIPGTASRSSTDRNGPCSVR